MIRQVDIDCAQCEEGSRLRAICDGTADMPLRKINAYREMILGLPPLEAGDRNVQKRDVRPQRPIRKRPPQQLSKNSVQRIERPVRKSGGCSSCGGKKRHVLRPNGYGPGSQLLKMFEASGVPHCQACIDMAAQMDAWGKTGCAKKLDVIVNDILPRAREWMADNKPWIHSLLSAARIEDVGLKFGIRQKVLAAIDKAAEPTTNSRRQVPRRRAGTFTKQKQQDTSNLISSTVIGQPTWTLGKHKTVRRIPFTREPTRNLVYHIYPARCDDVWRWNLDLLLKHIDLFSGRRIVTISVDDGSDSAEDVQDHLGDAVAEYLVFRNNKSACEMVSFIPAISQVESHDINEVTFRAHAKGVSRVCAERKKPHIREWIEAVYAANLSDWDLVKSHLEEAAFTGAFRKFDMFRKGKRLPVYSGSFYWFRNCYIFSREWYRVDGPRWGCESWPSKQFKEPETRCLFWDETGSMYSPKYWKTEVKPAYDKWCSERGIVV